MAAARNGNTIKHDGDRVTGFDAAGQEAITCKAQTSGQPCSQREFASAPPANVVYRHAPNAKGTVLGDFLQGLVLEGRIGQRNRPALLQ
jgi:hypothetical protein